MAMDICRGMIWIHSLGLIHRDLKPANLLVNSESVVKEHVRLKIADFGITRENEGSMTRSIGTLLYLAPECHLGRSSDRGKYDQTVDVYSFGLIFWEMFSSSSPFADIPPYDLPRQTINGLRPEISQRTPVKLSKLIQRCWHKKPKSRPSFQEVLATLETFYSEL